MIARHLLLALLLTVSSIGEQHVDEARGFQVEVPEGWSAKEQQTTEGFVLTLSPTSMGGEVGVSVTLLALEAGATTESLLESARKAVEAGGAQYSNYEEYSDRVGGEQAAGVRVTYSSAAGDYQLILSYVALNGRGYKLQRYAPAADYKKHARKLEQVGKSFRFVELSEEARAEQQLLELSARCGSEVHWAEDWAGAARRAREEDRLVLVVAFLYAGFSVTETPKTSVLMNQDVIELVNERYVPLWVTKGDLGVLGEFKERYGMGRFTFGQALMAATPDGELVLETSNATNSDVGYPFLVEALKRHPASTGLALPQLESDVLRAEALLGRGELDSALQRLDGDPSGRAHRLRARIFRLRREGSAALRELDLARKAGGEPKFELDLEEAKLRLREEEFDRTAALLRGVLQDCEEPDLLAQATFDLGSVEFALGLAKKAEKQWRTLIREQPESRWAWRAATGLQGVGLSLGAKPLVGWPDPKLLAEQLTYPSSHPDRDEGLEQVVSSALDWLLTDQCENGSWAGSNRDISKVGLGADPFIDSYTALAGSALLLHDEYEGSRVAAERALEFLKESIASRKATPPVVLYMDYMTWSDSIMLGFLVDAREAGLAKRSDLARPARALIEDLAERQQATGGWSYYKTADLEGDDAPAQSISFTTAAAVRALARADAAGFKVPREMFERGVEALGRMRSQDGVFSYFLYQNGGGGVSLDASAGEVGRGPVCELALEEAGVSSGERLEHSLDLFLQQAHLYQPEQGKVLMHAGPDGQGCHYLLFDYTHAALVHRRCGGSGKARAQILELVLDCRQKDGAFLDTPIMGRAFGTAMAVIALNALEVDG